jgi:hypothetical protein
MTEADYPTFQRSFERLSNTFRLKLKVPEREELARTYFRVLETAPLDEVLLAGKTCIAKHRTFPKPADWLAALDKGSPAACPANRRQMSVSEIGELAAAKRARYFESPCLCVECCRAGVYDKPLRFVPTLVSDEEERAFNPQRNVVEVVGHWAHGEELLRWYVARDAFAALSGHLPRRMRQAVFAAGAIEREPGQEG